VTDGDPIVLLRALADPGRLRVARLLVEGAFAVGEIATILGLPQSTTSRSLHLLQDAGLLSARREGKLVYFAYPPHLRGAAADLRELVARHAAPLPAEERRRLHAMWEGRRARSAAFFDEVDAADPGAAWLGSADCLPGVLEAVPPGARVADLGAGNGRLLPELAARSSSVVAVDASPRLLDQARRRVEALELRGVELRLGDLQHLPLRDGEVDVAVANMVLHHLAEPGAAFQEIARVLRPGGVVVVGDFLPHQEEWMRERLADQWLGIDPMALRQWFLASGFDPGEVREIPPRRPGALSVFVAHARRLPSPTAPLAPTP
jgi:ArsR family transcriptional regulator